MRMNVRTATNRTVLGLCVLLAACLSPTAFGDHEVLPTGPDAYQNFSMQDLQMDEEYRLGVEKYQLDHETRITGWQVSNRWFFGHQRGEDSGLTLVWQHQGEQISFSKDGVRFTRRF